MKRKLIAENRSPILFAVLTVLSFGTCFILLPLGSFTIWITVGATVYFLFLTVYTLVTRPSVSHRFVKKRHDPKAAEKEAYIRFHLRILLIMFSAAIFLVLVFLWFVR